MNLKCYLVVQGKTPKFGAHKDTTREPGAVRVAKTKPRTQADELAIQINLDIPDALFIKPSLTATITVPADQSITSEIDCEIQENIAQAIREASGMNVNLIVSGGDQ